MSKASLYHLQIVTKKASYTVPLVDVGKYRSQLQPQLGNPCLQIINEELSVLSILWELVVEINVGHIDAVDGKVSHRLETLYKAGSCTV